MKSQHYLIIFPIFLLSPFLCWSFSNNQNYIAVIEPFEKTKTEPVEYSDFSRISVNYYDGLGRETTFVTAGSGGDFQDIIQLTEYDSFGNISCKWQPVGNYGNAETLSKTTISSLSKSFYADDSAFILYSYDLSADMRVSSQQLPGKEREGKKRSTIFDFNTNNECLLFSINNGDLYRSGYYEAGQLYVERFTDEDGYTITKYTNFDGKIIAEAKNDITTHYVYDLCGRLSYVLSPEAVAAFSKDGICDNDIVDKLCTVYYYDERGRVIEKRMPGISPEYYVYDNLNRLILKQDGHLRTNSYWHFYAYDNKQRLALEGITQYRSTTPDELRTLYANKTINVEFDKTVDANISMHYRVLNNNFTQIKNSVAYYYDNYDFWTTNWPMPVCPDFPCEFISREGMPTGEAVYYEGFPIFRIRLYNDRNQEIAACEYNYNNEFHYSQFRKLNNFGQPEKILEIFDFPEGEYQTNPGHIQLNTTYSYLRPGGKLYSTTWKVDSSQSVSSIYNYDEIGRFKEQRNNKNIQKRMTYNTSGYPITIESPFYKEQLEYTPSGLISKRLSEYDIEGTKKQLGLAFSYDNYARLLYVDSYEAPNELLYGEFTELFDYDKNGNIKFLARGLQDGYSQMASFEYDGNRIISIEDTSEGLPLSKTPRFEAGSYSAPFAYDACGRITMDKTRGINKVYYNELGQTTRIDFDNQSNISTAYDAQGVKRSSSEFARYIETLPPATNTLDSPDRAQQYQTYNRKVEFLGKLERIDGENIRIDVGDGFFTGVFNSNNWKFHHYAKNHLGSIVTVTNDSNKLEQHTFYFASGLPIIIDADNTQITNERFHIGKTFKTFNGLHWYDNEARQYDPLLVRFTTPDPLAGNIPWISPYSYCSGNPINRIDPSGLADFLNHKGKIIGNDGVDDNRLLVVKTTKKRFPSTHDGNSTYIKGANLSWRSRRKIYKFIEKNSGDSEKFKNFDYSKTVEIESSSENRKKMIDIVSKDTGMGGTKDSNNREYGGVLTSSGEVIEATPGAVTTPSQGASISFEINKTDDATFHSHPSGTEREGTEASSKINTYNQPPSIEDVEGINNNTINYVFGMGNGKVYIYTKDGVQATLPIKRFVTPKK